MNEKTLLGLYGRFWNETGWIITSHASAVSRVRAGVQDVRVCRLAGEMAVVRLYDAWARFCRELVILSASGRPLTATGIILQNAAGIRARSDVIPTLISTYQKKKTEPNWASAPECIDAAKRLSIANYSTVSTAIGATNSPAREIRYVRNFFAHREEQCALELSKNVINSTCGRLNLETLTADIMPPGITRFESWVLDFRIVAEAAVQ